MWSVVALNETPVWVFERSTEVSGTTALVGSVTVPVTAAWSWAFARGSVSKAREKAKKDCQRRLLIGEFSLNTTYKLLSWSGIALSGLVLASLHAIRLPGRQAL